MPNYVVDDRLRWDGDKITDDLTSWDALWDPAYKGHSAMLDDHPRGVRGRRLPARARSEHDERGRPRPDARPARAAEAAASGRTPTTTSATMTSGQPSGSATPGRATVYQMIADKPNIKYVIPRRGRGPRLDTMVVLSGAPHPIAAKLWINFNLDAQVSAANTNYIGYMGPNAAADAVHRAGDPGDPTVNPPTSPSSTSSSSCSTWRRRPRQVHPALERAEGLTADRRRLADRDDVAAPTARRGAPSARSRRSAVRGRAAPDRERLGGLVFVAAGRRLAGGLLPRRRS